MFEGALAIRKAKLSANHPHLAYTYSALAFLDAATQEWAKSGEHFDLSRRGFRMHIDHVLPSLTETDQLALLKHTDEPHYHAALSLLLMQPDNESLNVLPVGCSMAKRSRSKRCHNARWLHETHTIRNWKQS